ncbi:flagellar hook protein FlgE [Candidatus Halocynthiibacter alkanivorans]|jgi:flagellar hook protein FlgE|uniref:flagellar hook protein FlgE n=1 Tax=Candidatus Halocynthiibacter alkanivorans TaxID=2267619 RepID=UPI000DF44434|nr:flagellar hook-basal body complex protein [Candidatus Halocynthiibacter alkanivorans]
MSISSSLNAGVAGLSANATKLAAIADNIANSSTYGYKRVSTNFESFVISSSAGAGTYSAGGVSARTTRLIEDSGPVVGTANSMDLAVNGRGMLPVTAETTIGSAMDNNSLMMTTTGSFRTDANGVLKTSTGLVLMGWPADGDGNIPTQPRDSIAGLEPVVINANQTAGDPTTKITLGVNLPAVDTETGAPGDTLPLSVEYFGNLGTSESLDVTFTPTVPVAGSSNEWTMVIKDSAQAGAVVGQYTLTFDDSRTSGGTLSAVTPIDISVGVPSPAYDSVTGTVNLTVDGGPMEITLGKSNDPNGLTQLATSFSPTNVTKDGSPVGNLNTVEIDDAGYISATYDTGFTRVIYQIPLVDVPNPNGLTSMDNQTYQVSPSSGNFFLWDAGNGPTGTTAGYAREGSTTDVASELTDLIQTQRAYSSNAKVIQTVDEMLQETTNIKR